MAFTFLRALGHGVGRSLRRARSRRDGARGAGDGAAPRRPDRAARRRRGGGRARQPRRAARSAIRDIPAAQMGLDIGPLTVERFAAVLRTRADRRLERAHGRVREAAPFATGTRRAGARRRRVVGVLRHRRRRHGGGREPGRRRRPDRLHLDGRRRLPGVPGGPDAAGRRGPDGAPDAHARSSSATGRCTARSPRRGRWPRRVRDGLKRPGRVEVVVCPPFTALPAVGEILAGGPIALGAQNCHHERLGRAHRRGRAADARRAGLPLRHRAATPSAGGRWARPTSRSTARSPPRWPHGLTPILCVGETGEERRQGLTFTTVEGQLRAGLAGLEPADASAAACSPTSRCGRSAPA